jgi:hypothetical protein
MARPRKNIDPEQVRMLADFGLTHKDIASFVGCSQSLISQRFSSSYDLGVKQSRKSLRVMMWRQARRGNASIKLRLDQRLFGPLERKQAVDDSQVVEALDQAERAAAEKLA